MFRGANAINLDTKGRLTVPTRYRQSLMDDCQGQLVCTVDNRQSCLLLYPLPEWDIIEEKISKFSTMNPDERRIQRLLIGYATDVDMDKSGRVLIASTLRQYANLDKEIMLVGQRNRIEIWSQDTWFAQVEEDLKIEKAGDYEQTERLQDFSL
ncbi:MAG: MraZ protein [Alphaproteobacteria bacterium]|jgi:MraZ protein